MEVFHLILTLFVCATGITLLFSVRKKERMVSIGKDISSFFGLSFAKGGLINSQFVFKSSGSISGYNVEVFSKQEFNDISTYVILYFNKLEQKKADKILLDIQNGSMLAPHSEIYIITGGLRLKIFVSDKPSQFYIDSINLLINTCKKHKSH